MDAFLGFLNNDLVLTLAGLIWGFVVKHHPGWKSVPNAFIPYGAAILTFFVKVFAPGEAHAYTLAALPLVSAGAGILGAALAAGWQAILNSLIYETFLRKPSQAVLGKP